MSNCYFRFGHLESDIELLTEMINFEDTFLNLIIWLPKDYVAHKFDLVCVLLLVYQYYFGIKKRIAIILLL